MATEIFPRDNVLQLLKALPIGDQKSVMEAFIFGSTSKKGRAPKAEGAPKRAVTADSYMHLVNAVVWPILKAYSESLEDGDAKKTINTVSCRTQVSSALWAPIKELESEERAEAKEALDVWKLNPPTPHCKADKEARSVGSAGSKSSGASKKLADMSEDEKKAYYKARAAKAAATRAANKASAGGSAEAEEEDYSGDNAKEWVHKGKTYLRAKNYLWDAETNDYVGGWNEAKKVIDKKVPAPDTE